MSEFDLDLDFSFYMVSIWWLNQTQGLIFICELVTDVSWYSYMKENTFGSHKTSRLLLFTD